MSRIDSRLKRLEQALGELGACRCGRDGKPGAAVYYPDLGQEQPPDICLGCGGKRIIYAIVYETEWPNHHTTACEGGS